MTDSLDREAQSTVERLDPGGWAPYLDPDEHLLWEGQPAGGLRVEAQSLVQTAFGIFFLGFSIFWVIGASAAGGAFGLFGLPFVAVGCWLVFGHYFWDAWARSRTRYALTSKRAFIAENTFSRSLKNWPIDEDTQLDFRPGSLASIYFATELYTTTSRRRHGGTRTRTRTRKIGFRWISDGDRVYQLFRHVQRGDG